MIKNIALQEFKGYWYSPIFKVASIILSFLFLTSLWSSFNYYNILQKQAQEATQTARSIWENQEDKNPHSAAHYGTYAFKPVYPLSFFDRGVDAYTGNTLFLEAHKMNEAQYLSAADRSELTRISALTPAYILSVLFPLFIMVLGFGIVAKDWESSNLRLIMAQGVSPFQLFFGKVLGLWGIAALLMFPFFVLGTIGLFLPKTTGEDWLRYGFLLLSYVLYLGCFVHLTLLISAWSRRTNVALVASLGVWIFVCLVAPRATTNLAKWIYPTPDWQTYQDGITKDLEDGVDGHDAADAYTQKLEKETLEKYKVGKVDSLPFNWMGFVMQKGEEHETYVFQKHKDKLLAIFQQQEKVHQSVACLSPFLLNNSVSQALSATDVTTYYGFLDAAEKYRIQLVGELNKDLTDNFKYKDWSSKRGKAFFEKNTTFDYQRPVFSQVFAQIAPVLVALLAWFLLSAVLGYLFIKNLKLV